MFADPIRSTESGLFRNARFKYIKQAPKTESLRLAHSDCTTVFWARVKRLVETSHRGINSCIRPFPKAFVILGKKPQAQKVGSILEG